MYGILSDDPRMQMMMRRQGQPEGGPRGRMPRANPGGPPADDPSALAVPMGPQMGPSQGFDRFPKAGQQPRQQYPVASQPLPTGNPHQNAAMEQQKMRALMMGGGPGGGGYGQGPMGAGSMGMNPMMAFPGFAWGLK